jgi:arsenate reductase
MLFKEINNYISELKLSNISDNRLHNINKIIQYIQNTKDNNEEINLNFICTHNSRRSQLAQIWASVLAYKYKINISCYSGGVEVTELNKNIATCLENIGFNINSKGKLNPKYNISYSKHQNPIIAFSKLYNDSYNSNNNFAAIMTCNDADSNCPIIKGAIQRISFTFDDPKIYDNTNKETIMYNKCSKEIARELLYIFSKIK